MNSNAYSIAHETLLQFLLRLYYPLPGFMLLFIIRSFMHHFSQLCTDDSATLNFNRQNSNSKNDLLFYHRWTLLSQNLNSFHIQFFINLSIEKLMSKKGYTFRNGL